MSVNYSEWSKEDFVNFLLLHVAKSDFHLSEDELDMLNSHMNDSDIKIYTKLHKSNSDIENIQLIQNLGEKFCSTSEEKEEIMNKVQQMTMADDILNVHEKTVVNALNLLL